MSQIATRIRAARKAQGLTIERLAFASGVSVSTINRAESGDNDPSLRSLMAIANALNVPVTSLLAPEPEGQAS